MSLRVRKTKESFYIRGKPNSEPRHVRDAGVETLPLGEAGKRAPQEGFTGWCP